MRSVFIGSLAVASALLANVALGDGVTNNKRPLIQLVDGITNNKRPLIAVA